MFIRQRDCGANEKQCHRVWLVPEKRCFRLKPSVCVVVLFLVLVLHLKIDWLCPRTINKFCLALKREAVGMIGFSVCFKSVPHKADVKITPWNLLMLHGPFVVLSDCTWIFVCFTLIWCQTDWKWDCALTLSPLRSKKGFVMFVLIDSCDGKEKTAKLFCLGSRVPRSRPHCGTAEIKRAEELRLSRFGD